MNKFLIGISFLFLFLILQEGCNSTPKKVKLKEGINWKEVRIKLDKIEDFSVSGNSMIIVSSSHSLKDLKYFTKSFSQKKDFPESIGNRLYIKFSDDKFIYKNKGFRGSLELVPSSDKSSLVINIVNLEDYLLAVVPSEMPASWPIEALKAQSIAARTYAIYYVQNPLHSEYHLEADVQSQVYAGIARENANSTNAVKDTLGQVIIYNELPLQAFFHSNSGGMTESPHFVWGGEPVEYLVSVPSEYCNTDGGMAWTLYLSKADISEKFKDLKIGNIIDIVIKERSPSNRAVLIELVGDKGQATVKGTDFRKTIGYGKLKSLLFDYTKEENGISFSGKGFGHGVGMSQWGAFHMANKNYKYNDIILYYYKKTELITIDD